MQYLQGNKDDYPGFHPKTTPAQHKILKSSAIKGIEFSGGYFPTIASS